jgi:hypothetical protein
MSISAIVPICVTVFTSFAWSQAVPSFEGQWVLNSQKSSFATTRPQHSDVEITVSQNAGVIQSEWQIKSNSGTVQLRLQFTTDGKPTSNHESNQSAFESLTKVDGDGSYGGIEVSSRWEGRELKVQSIWYRPNKRVFELDDTWKLSADKNTLILDRTSGRHHSPSGVDTLETHEVLVFERSPTPQKRGK